MTPARLIEAKGTGPPDTEDLEPEADQTANADPPDEGTADTPPETTLTAVTHALDEAVVLAEATEGQTFEVLVIRPGTSKNRRRYSRKVLEEAVPLFNKAVSYASEGPDHDPRKRGVKSLVGFWKDAEYATGIELPNGKTAEGVKAVYHVTDRGLAANLRASLAAGRPDYIQFSIVGDGKTARIRGTQGQFVDDVLRIDSIESVDPVVHAAAGGMAVRLVASAEVPTMQWDKLTLAEAVKGLTDGTITADDLRENRVDLLEALVAKVTEPEKKAEKAEPKVAIPAGMTEADVKAIVEAAVAPYQTERLVEAAIKARPKLPQKVADRIRNAAAGKVLDEDKVSALVESEVEYLKALNPALIEEKVPEVTDMKSESDRISEHVYDMLTGKSNDSIKALYVDLTGDRAFKGRLAEGGRLSEAIATTTFAEILGDSITRRMLDIYRLPALQEWRKVVNVVPVNDFRTQNRIRMGGYGNLPDVTQGDPYVALTSPGDEQATYAATKRGGLETITLETIVNDDLGAMRQIPVRLGRAAGQTLHEYTFDFLADNPTIYDSTALFHGDHGNLGSTALDSAPLTAGRLAMVKQADMSNDKRLGLLPKYLVVPVDLEETAWTLVATPQVVGSDYNDRSFIPTMGIEVITVPYWTDATDWFLCADPNLTPTIEVGFLNGQQEPELLLQDNPTVGEVFSNDQLTWRIRHIYGGAVVDFRGLYGAICT